ncbi:hypothetical protein BC940DRAFT_294125, partial [Gongronella butleri]
MTITGMSLITSSKMMFPKDFVWYGLMPIANLFICFFSMAIALYMSAAFFEDELHQYSSLD